MKRIILILALVLSPLLAAPTFAQDGEVVSVVSGGIENPFKCPNDECTIASLLEAIIVDVLFPIGSIVAVVAFIWVGFMFVIARGNPADLEKAKRALLYTVIGTALLLGATALTKVITGTLGALQNT